MSQPTDRVSVQSFFSGFYHSFSLVNVIWIKGLFSEVRTTERWQNIQDPPVHLWGVTGLKNNHFTSVMNQDPQSQSKKPVCNWCTAKNAPSKLKYIENKWKVMLMKMILFDQHSRITDLKQVHISQWKVTSKFVI